MNVKDLERAGSKLVLPEKMTLDSAIETLQRIKKYEEETTEIVHEFGGFPWDAAIAFNRAMQKTFGWASAEAIDHYFMGMEMASDPPRMVRVMVSPSDSGLVALGRFTLPGITGYVTTGIGQHKRTDPMFFHVIAMVKRKDEEAVQALFAKTEETLMTESIYRGKAFKLRLLEDDGSRNTEAMPKFLGLSKVKPGELVFSEDVNEAIATSLFTPIEETAKCREFNIPLKRGVLLYGPYGTGKTLAAHVTAKKCTENGWTFLYCERADELADMVKLAHQYQPSVVFCEDIDRAMSGERSVAIDDILNIIDGIESKGVELMVILTTNHVESLNKALLRPGRLDAVINVLPPDAKAVEKLLRIYGRGLIPENADLSEVGETLAGTIPAVIRECAERAKLSQIKLNAGTEFEGQMLITPEALLDAAKGMKNQLDLLAEPKRDDSPAERLAKGLQEVVQHAHNGDISEIVDTCRTLRGRWASR